MREYNVGAVYINDNVYAGETNIPLLKGNQGYSISRVVKTSGTGTPGSYDTYTIYINTDPESIVGTFQVWNGTGNIGDMTKAEYDTDNDGIVDNAERVNNHTVDIDVPSNAKFTDTVYDDTAITNRVTTLENAGYITKSVSDLVNYYTKTETYTKAEVNALVDTIPKFAIEVVNSLPTHDISTTTIYLVRDDSQTGDIYQEFIYVNNTWELLGAQRIDLSNYYTKSETYAKTETYNKTEVDNAIASIEGNEVIITDDPTELDDQKLWVDTSGTIPYINSEIAIGSSNSDNRPVWFKKGKNLFNKNNVSKLNAYFNVSTPTITSSDYNRTLYIPCKTNTTYSVTIPSGTGAFAFGYTTNLPAVNVSVSGVIDGDNRTLTTGANAKYLVLRYFQTNNATITEQQALNGIQIEEGSTATTYEEYIAPSINVDGEEIYNKIEDSGWQTPIIGSDFNIGGSFRYRKIGSIVFVNLTVSAKNNIALLDALNVIATGLPAPNTDMELATYIATGNLTFRICLRTTGNLQLYWNTAGTLQANKNFTITFTYMV